MDNLRREKPRVEEKEIHYIKRLIQKGRIVNGYNWNIIIITLKLYIITHIYIHIASPHMLHLELFESDQIYFGSPNSNI